MYYYKPKKILFNNRKEIKAYLGGTNALNKAMKDKQIIIIYAELQNIADNGIIQHNKQKDIGH
jgi:hypothetical protein